MGKSENREVTLRREEELAAYDAMMEELAKEKVDGSGSAPVPVPTAPGKRSTLKEGYAKWVANGGPQRLLAQTRRGTANHGAAATEKKGGARKNRKTRKIRRFKNRK